LLVLLWTGLLLLLSGGLLMVAGSRRPRRSVSPVGAI
jgi:hypothetical protein